MCAWLLETRTCAAGAHTHAHTDAHRHPHTNTHAHMHYACAGFTGFTLIWYSASSSQITHHSSTVCPCGSLPLTAHTRARAQGHLPAKRAHALVHTHTPTHPVRCARAHRLTHAHTRTSHAEQRSAFALDSHRLHCAPARVEAAVRARAPTRVPAHAWACLCLRAPMRGAVGMCGGVWACVRQRVPARFARPFERTACAAAAVATLGSLDR